MQWKKHLMRAELSPLFVALGAGSVLCTWYVWRLAVKGPEVTWSRARNPEPWKAKIPQKVFGTDTSTMPRPAPDEAYEAIGE